MKQPIIDNDIDKNYKIELEIPDYAVVLTPCCSIGEKVLSLAPLIQARSKFYKNEFFSGDLTRINRRLPDPSKAWAIADWESKEDEEKQSILEKNDPYTLVNFFIYEENDLFPEYTLRSRNIRYHMINFNTVYNVKCDLIKRADEMRDGDLILKSKILELSIDARKDLYEKISFYYRTPIEDRASED